MLEVDVKTVKCPKLKVEVPPFHKHRVNFKGIEKLARKYARFKNYIILANGGSRTSSYAFYHLGSKKNFEFIPTMEPEVLLNAARKYKKEDTLVMPISKSGTNVCPLEGMFFFMKKGYKILPITSKGSVLDRIAKQMKYDVAYHPDIGGRYSGRTICGLLPAKLMGLNIRKINQGAISIYKRCSPGIPQNKNPALRISAFLYDLEKKGYEDVFLAVYSKSFSGFIPLIVQLMHESFGKQGKGMSFFGDLGPEMQHHTNQRFYGGRKNIVGMFISVKEHKSLKISVPKSLRDIKIRNGILGDLNSLDLANALSFELKANLMETESLSIPEIHIRMDRADEYTFGELMGMMQYIAVYSSVLRGVNPYDQPQVEHSKAVSFDMIRKH